MKPNKSRSVRGATRALSIVLAAATANAWAGVSVTESGGATAVAEGGGIDTYTLVLTARPASDVTVTLNPGEQLRVDPKTVTFTPADFDRPKTIAVSALDDPAAESNPHPGAVTHGVLSADPAYGPQTPVSAVAVSITDNDVAGLIVSETDGGTVVTEGVGDASRDVYTIVLTRQPTGDVTVTVGFDDTSQTTGSGDVTFTPAQLVFTPQNYRTPQTVTVVAVDDASEEGSEETEVLRHRVTSLDPAYGDENLAPRKVGVIVRDNDTPGIVLAETGQSTRVAEGGATDTYSLQLTTKPSTEGAVTITVNPDSEFTASPSSVTFNSTSYNTPQSITITAVDDMDPEESVPFPITHRVDSTDSAYGAALTPVPPLSALLIDNDTPAVIVSESGGETRLLEGDPEGDSYTLVLTRQPAHPVTVTVDTEGQLFADPASVTFQSTDFATPRTVKLIALDDARAGATRYATITHTVTSDDAAYQSVPVSSVTAEIMDSGAVAPQNGGAGGGGSLSWATLAGLLLCCLSPLLACLRKGQG